MSIRQINVRSITEAVEHGHDTVDKLAEHFEVPFFFRNLTDRIDEAVNVGAIRRTDSGRLVPHDLFEPLED